MNDWLQVATLVTQTTLFPLGIVIIATFMRRRDIARSVGEGFERVARH
jgi:hypothetical protein